MILDVVPTVAARLQSHAVIGAYALAARGYIRHTSDFDLLTTDRSALTTAKWADLTDRGVHVDIRRGDRDDPLGGVVRIQSDTFSIDVVVAKYKWQQMVIDRAEEMAIAGTRLRVPLTRDLVLLKLFAGGYGDLHDIDRLLATDRRPELITDVTDALRDLPPEMNERWQKLLRDRAS